MIRFPARAGAVVLLTSYFWEGSAALKALIDHGVPVTDLVVQKPWWTDQSIQRARMDYTLRSLRHRNTGTEQRYFSLEALARSADIPVTYIKNINDAACRWAADDIRLVVVAGSRIIKPDVVALLDLKLVNFHSGLLPFYRGPYSEFWAMHDDRPDQVGCSVHLIDEGIDTGALLAVEAIGVPSADSTPQEAHWHNVLRGVSLLARTVQLYLDGEIAPQVQPPGGRTFRHPARDDLDAMERRIGRSFDVSFIE